MEMHVQQGDSNKWPYIGFGEEIMHALSIEVDFMLLVLSSSVKNVSYLL